ncbi:hypothetical protein HYDPIDRAFT_170938 [Hydnomerulius pinastri MD-312]|uniref:Uncharacterized protein n=1 Tax=Hydnomerulius pinastri MD-312 TaxID=994086 RepID=A0A0C9V1P0_9AGAM|nr:hypothetical protein HYDPIDRAFT_170938 [Hydnomerulius pinastri MD-312]
MLDFRLKLYSDSFKRTLVCLLSPNADASTTDTAIKIFHDITSEEYEAITQLVQESPLPKKPRLSHHSSDGIIIMEWPRATHEAPLTDLREIISPAMRLLPFDKCKVRALVEMNSPFQSPESGFSATSDLSLVLMSLLGSGNREILILAECAFSQDEQSLRDKVKKELAAHPKVVLFFMIIVSEVEEYHGPKEGTDAWNYFADEARCRDAQSFLSLQEQPLASGAARVMVAGHNWCNISSVDYYVWVKQDDKQIDIDNPNNMVHDHCILTRIFLPDIEMEDVKLMIKKGLLKARDSIVTFCKKLDPEADTRALQSAEIVCVVDWEICQMALVAAATATAHDRYQGWYNAVFRGLKCPLSDDEEYKPSNEDSGVDTSNSDSSPTQTPPIDATRAMCSKLRRLG